MNQDERCPCGSGKTHQECCLPYLAGAAAPATPEQLMRARYSAFCQENMDYLLATHHSSQRTADERQVLAHTMAQTEWVSLRVLNAGANTVEFVAFYKQNGALDQLHERSTFVQENGRWTYLRGVMLEPIQLGRNDACWCGSHKKYKKCHGA